MNRINKKDNNKMYREDNNRIYKEDKKIKVNKISMLMRKKIIMSNLPKLK